MADADAGTPAAVAEVHRLHDVIEDWFAGATGDLAPFADALDATFHIVSPDGTTRTREDVVVSLRDARGAHAGEEPPFVVDVRDATLRESVADRHLVTYEEHQRVAGGWTARTSTAWLREDPDAPGGVAWVHLHETWLDDGA